MTPIAPSIQALLDRLRPCSQADIQSRWRWQATDLSAEQVFASTDPLHWPIAPLNDRQHIAWKKGQPLWLYQQITVPSQLQGYPLAGLTLRLSLAWWAELAEIFVEGELVQTGDLYDYFTRICLSPAVTAAQTLRVALRLFSPRHDRGALVRSHLLYEIPSENTAASPEPAFVADELAVLERYLAAFAPAELEKLVTEIQDWPDLDHPTARIPHLRESLLVYSPYLKKRQIHCVGHAHLDLAWLWPVSETWEAAERTFQSVLDLQKEFPELTYTHSSPALFDWLEHNRPALFQQIQKKVKQGAWTIDAGLWVEPELNLISGESIARQILYGQRYTHEKFGQISQTAWLPDSFGFCWQLPQLLKESGIETFATLKLSWNDTTQFPHNLFWWQSPDGSRIRALMLPPIGADIDPVQMADRAADWEAETQIPHSLWLPGIGDHGGGPTRDMLEKAQRWNRSPFFPTLSFTPLPDYIDLISQQSQDLPTWNDELYLELHRGCYTTHADQKQANRRCEDLLYQAELWAAIAALLTNYPYPQAQLEAAWKKLLFNQFHDILPGSAIPEVFADANRDWEAVKATGTQVMQAGLGAIAATVPLPPPPQPDAQAYLVFNALNWDRTEVVTLTLPHTSKWQVRDFEGEVLPTQVCSETVAEERCDRVCFLAESVPSVGYRGFWLCPEASAAEPQKPSAYVMENQFLKATVDPKTGEISSLWSYSAQRESLSAPANQLLAWRDQGQYWDAWNIAPDYADHPLPPAQLTSIAWMETGPVRQRLRIVRRLNQSEFVQDYILDQGSPVLKVETWADWQETHVLLKVNFPVAIAARQATYEIPFGAIQRPTQPQTAAEKAKWEVPALRWADLSQADFGVSLLTDCKHGFDASPGQLRLTLLKAPVWPDPGCDRGPHHFSYAIYPHAKNWQAAKTVHQAHALNIFLAPYLCEATSGPVTSHANQTGPCSFLRLTAKNLILSAFKPSEDEPKQFILRCYDAYGQSARLELENALDVQVQEQLNLLEMPLSTKNSKKTNWPISPWQVSTYRLERNPE
ncbi:alpha-mannosidase [Romeria aff. gracilis LEGE 07310]|uniref:Alpha-mannosidase n=1 Tax=Vasconcelosia minhoensis LEGE 07310 TaxID=915328 RepID=A0A8J7A8U1_9CYAN|nr:alpha-mannosidase [Romeria gracilis]MBE9076121.1 alpha-mannosidase [Romeria aff. gracilis LEGE 07310]